MKKRNSRKTAVIAMGVVTGTYDDSLLHDPVGKGIVYQHGCGAEQGTQCANVDAATVESYSAADG